MGRVVIKAFPMAFLLLITIGSAPAEFVAANPVHFVGVTPTSQWVDFFGEIKIDGIGAEVGDEVAAFDADGSLAGVFVVQESGSYGFLHVYRDDPETPRDEGAEPGDHITFRVWDASQNRESDAESVPISGPSPPQWTADGDRWNVYVRSC